MICYKGRTFCSQSNKCVNVCCDRWLSPEEDTNGLPVSLADFKTEDCGYLPNPILEQLETIVGEKK